MRLNLGCGADHRAGYVNVDLYTPADRQDNIVTLETFEEASADEILAHHSLETRLADAICARIPMRRFGDPANVAAAIRFCIAADYMTGAVIDINGGLP